MDQGARPNAAGDGVGVAWWTSGGDNPKNLLAQLSVIEFLKMMSMVSDLLFGQERQGEDCVQGVDHIGQR